MDRATDSIEQHIYRERAVLRSNLEELEDRVRAVVDWRRHFRSSPALWLGCAFAGGLLIALGARPEEASRPLAYRREGEPFTRYPDHRQREISRAWRTIESALIGLAAGKLKEALARVIPGFHEQLARREGADYVHDFPGNNRSRHERHSQH
ncbi:MAG TPA: hypothetical protein VI195_05570 [Steroidobacteraceae bacterium]